VEEFIQTTKYCRIYITLFLLKLKNLPQRPNIYRQGSASIVIRLELRASKTNFTHVKKARKISSSRVRPD
jgi:hypothetical protein